MTLRKKKKESMSNEFDTPSFGELEQPVSNSEPNFDKLKAVMEEPELIKENHQGHGDKEGEPIITSFQEPDLPEPPTQIEVSSEQPSEPEIKTHSVPKEDQTTQVDQELSEQEVVLTISKDNQTGTLEAEVLPTEEGTGVKIVLTSDGEQKYKTIIKEYSSKETRATVFNTLTRGLPFRTLSKKTIADLLRDMENLYNSKEIGSSKIVKKFRNLQEFNSAVAELYRLTEIEKENLPVKNEETLRPYLERMELLNLVRYNFSENTFTAFRYKELEDKINDGTGEWRQDVVDLNLKDKAYRAITPRARSLKDKAVKGKDLIDQINIKRNESGTIYMPLYHSGLWIRIEAPTAREVLNLQIKTSEKKIEAGRGLLGAIFSNDFCIYAEELFNLVLDKIKITSLGKSSSDEISKLNLSQIKAELGDYVRLKDLPLLALNLAATMYPQGFKYTRNVRDTSSDIGVTEDVRSGLLDLTKLTWYNNKTIPEFCKNHMSKSGLNSHSFDDVNEYQKHFSVVSEKEIEIEPNVFLTLYDPTINEYLEYANRWLIDIEVETNNLFDIELNASTITEEEKEAKRKEYVDNILKSEYLRRYGHLVKQVRFVFRSDNIEEQDEEVIVTHEDKEAIDSLLNKWSQDEALSETFFTSVKNYLAESTVAVAGMLQPVGGEGELRLLPNILPIDPIALFFSIVTIQSVKISRIQVV